MDPTSDHIISLTDQVLDSIIGANAVPCDASVLTDDDLAVSSCVHITGGWEGTVVVRSSRDLAREVTEAMFGMDAGEATAADVEDAFGEVANMIGGNVKSLVPGPSLLSLPVVVVGESMAFPRSEPCADAVFTVLEKAFTVSVLRRSAGADHADHNHDLAHAGN